MLIHEEQVAEITQVPKNYNEFVRQSEITDWIAEQNLNKTLLTSRKCIYDISKQRGIWSCSFKTLFIITASVLQYSLLQLLSSEHIIQEFGKRVNISESQVLLLQEVMLDYHVGLYHVGLPYLQRIENDRIQEGNNDGQLPFGPITKMSINPLLEQLELSEFQCVIRIHRKFVRATCCISYHHINRFILQDELTGIAQGDRSH